MSDTEEDVDVDVAADMPQVDERGFPIGSGTGGGSRVVARANPLQLKLEAQKREAEAAAKKEAKRIAMASRLSAFQKDAGHSATPESASAATVAAPEPVALAKVVEKVILDSRVVGMMKSEFVCEDWKCGARRFAVCASPCCCVRVSVVPCVPCRACSNATDPRLITSRPPPFLHSEKAELCLRIEFLAREGTAALHRDLVERVGPWGRSQWSPRRKRMNRRVLSRRTSLAIRRDQGLVHRVLMVLRSLMTMTAIMRR
jgi:hypothetical protein